MRKTLLKNEKGFTLIEIIAVLVILGILAAIAIPKYMDMRADAVLKAAQGANSELNARERLTLAAWKLKGCTGVYPDLNSTGDSSQCDPNTAAMVPATTALGADWNSGVAIVSGTGVTFQGKTVTFTRNPPAETGATPGTNEPYYWTVAVS